ncbi:MAG: hypothetical protein U9P72_08265 [Campylobacterota bacterium]|nr:hypothetical protein [Campylobacterota bacterium]
MKYLLLFLVLFGTPVLAVDGFPDDPMIEAYQDDAKPKEKEKSLLKVDSFINISVVGQGIAPSFARSPAQSFVLAKRAAMGDAYRIIAERIKGVKVEGKDTIKNMAIKSSVVNMRVSAMIKDATVVETTFKDGLCEVEMEIKIYHDNFK